jgi:hypothetical protein
MVKTCSFFLKGTCKKGNNCKFKHEFPVVYNSKSSQSSKNFRESIKRKGNKRRHPKNTESFKPSFKPPDMRIISTIANHDKYPRKFSNNDIIIVNGLFGKESDMNIRDKLLQETDNASKNNIDLFKLWHGDTHYIADDKLGWKKNCPTFNMVVKKLSDYFNVDVKATRFNVYKDSSQWKPFHHDAAAIKKDKAASQNITIAVSFGLEREVAFEHSKTKTVLSIPLPNGSIYVFNKDVNINWKHGIRQIPEPIINEERISIILWGWVKMNESN